MIGQNNRIFKPFYVILLFFSRHRKKKLTYDKALIYICRSCGEPSGWSHVCEGIQLGGDGEVDPLLLDLFPALNTVISTSDQSSRLQKRSEMSVIHEIERPDVEISMIDQEIRISIERESDLQHRKQISKEKKKRAEDYHQLWEWFSTIKDRWAWIANSSLSQITDSSNPTRLRKPKGCLGTRVISPEVWRHVAESTANVLDTTEGLRGPLPAVPYGSPEEIERMCMACSPIQPFIQVILRIHISKVKQSLMRPHLLSCVR